MRVLNVDDGVFSPKPDLTEGRDEPSHALIERWLADVLGRLVPGDKLPSEGDLSTSLRVSRMTLRQALGALESRGLVERKRGRSGGTFVSRPRIECDLTGLSSFTEQMQRAHVGASTRVVSKQLGAASAEIAAALELSRHADVVKIVRVRLAGREPLALEETYLAADDFPALLDRRLTGSLYALMRRDYDLSPVTAREWLEPVIATREQSRLLGTAADSALMLVTRTAYTASGKPIEHAFDRYRADRTRITLQTGVAQRLGETVTTELTAAQPARLRPPPRAVTRRYRP